MRPSSPWWTWRDAPTLVRILVAVVALAPAWTLVGAQTKGRPGGQSTTAPPPATSAVQVQPAAARRGAAPVAPGCGTPFVMPDESFRALDGVRDASLWVDDIDAGLFGGFGPFEIYVVTGRLYAPFQLRQGKLGRDNFRRYTANNYNTLRQGPLTLSSQRSRGDLAFTQDDRRFRLKITGIQPSTFDRDTITAQLCW
jgi:hypothetical protein